MFLKVYLFSINTQVKMKRGKMIVTKEFKERLTAHTVDPLQ